MREVATGTDGTVEQASCRAFRLSDAIILIAGAALALAAGSHLLMLGAGMLVRLCQEAAAHRADLFANWPLFWRSIRDPLSNTLWYGFQAAEITLFGLTPACFVLRLRRPRPPLLDLLRQPGTVALLAMVFGLFWVTGALLVLFPGKVDSMTAAPTAVGGTVAVAWVVLALSRRWRPEAGWVDRMGRLLGCASIVTALIGHMVFWI